MIEPIAVKPVENATLVPTALSVEEKGEKERLEAIAARKEANFPGASELARTTSAPVANAGSTTAEVKAQDEAPVQELKEEIPPSANSLVSIAPEDQLNAFAAVDAPAAPTPAPTETKTEDKVPTASEASGTAKTEEAQAAPTEVAKVGSVEEAEEVSEEASAKEVDESQANEAIQTIAQDIPAKAGALLDIAV